MNVGKLKNVLDKKGKEEKKFCKNTMFFKKRKKILSLLGREKYGIVYHPFFICIE